MIGGSTRLDVSWGGPRAVGSPRIADLRDHARNLLYTGVTRGKMPVVLVGQRKAIAMAVRNGEQRRRWSKLQEWPQTGGLGGGARRRSWQLPGPTFSLPLTRQRISATDFS